MRALHVAMSLSVAIFLMIPSGSVLAANETARVLIDFGDGSYVWEEVGLGAGRSAFNATRTAAQQADLNFEYTWFAFGVMVNDIGDRDPAYPIWWHLFIWNRTTEGWNLADVGASDLVLADDDAIAWYLAVDGPSSTPSPSPTPLSPYPSLFARGDLANSGEYQGMLCDEYEHGWEYDTGSFEISGTPAESGGTLYVPTWTGLVAIDTRAGRMLWHRDDIRGMSSPAVMGDDLFIGGRDGNLHHVSASTGVEEWSTRLIASPVFTGIASSPKAYMGGVYVGLFNETGGNGGVAAVDFWSGALLWRHESPSVHMSSPAIRDSTLYIGLAGFFDNSSSSFTEPYGLLALNLVNGSERWFFETHGPVMSSPMILGSKVYFTSRDGFLHALWLNGTEEWNRTTLPSTSSPATDGTRVFIGGGVLGTNGSVAAFTQEGDRLWEKEMTGPVQTSPTQADGLLFVGTNEAHGTYYALNASDGGIVWEFTPSPGDYILSSTVIADGDLYMSSDNGIVYQLACHRPGQGWGAFSYAAMIAGALGLVAVAEISLRGYRRRLR